MYIAGLWPVNNGKQYNWIDSAGNSGQTNFILPIELSKSWLIYFGFTEVDNRSITRTWLYDGDKLITQSNSFYMVGILSEMKYVHQLQNAFYAIYGKELVLPNNTVLPPTTKI